MKVKNRFLNYNTPPLYKRVVFFLFIMGIYAKFHFDISNTFSIPGTTNFIIPYFICLIAGILIFISNKFIIEKSTLIYFAFFTLLNIGLFIGYSMLGRNLAQIYLSIFQFEVAVFFCLLFYDEIRKWNNLYLAKFFKHLTYFILLLCLLDFIPIFHQLSVQIMGTEESLLNMIRKDIYFFGLRLHRPFPFTMEPSHVAKLILVILPGWLVLSERKEFKKYFILTIAALIIIRSPIILGVFGMGVILLLKEFRLKDKTLSVVVIPTISIILIGVMISSFLIALGPRALSILGGYDTSTLYRIVRPFYILKGAITEFPLFGVGFGNTKLLLDVYGSRGFYLVSENMANNYLLPSLFGFFAYIGLIGTIGHAYLANKLLKLKNAKIKVFHFVVHLFLIAIATAGFFTMIFWGYLFILFRIYSNSISNK